MLWLFAALFLLAALVAAVTLLSARGRRRWCAQSSAWTAGLAAGRGAAAGAHFDPAELTGLPAPVQRYLRAVLTAGQPMVSGMRMTQSGFINLSPTGTRWQPFTAEHQVATRGPGFLWNARVGWVAGLSVRVHDGYLAGVGLYPTVLLPSQGVQWAAVDARHADATLVDGAVSVTLRFTFGDAGLVEAVRSDGRGRMVGRALEMTRWEGRWKDWAIRDGMRVPLAGEVAWLVLGERRTYWSGRVGKLRYRFSS